RQHRFQQRQAERAANSLKHGAAADGEGHGFSPRAFRNGVLWTMSFTRAEKRNSCFSRSSTIVSIAQRSYDSNPRPRAKTSIFSARQRPNSAFRRFSVSASSAGPRNRAPLGSLPDESTASFPSLSRQRPMA